MNPCRLPCVLLLAGAVLAQEPIPPRAEPKPADPTEPAVTAPPAAAKGAPAAAPGGLTVVDLAQAMAATMRWSAPGQAHRRLAALAGRFDVDMMLQPVGIERQHCTGTARAAAVLGGRYLIVNCTVKVHDVPLEGLYIFGFDNLHGLYTASWRDSLSTWSIECSGPPAAGADEPIELQGTMVDAASPTGRPFRMTLRCADDGFDIRVRDSAGDQLVEVMQQTFRRQATPPATELPPADGKGDGAARGK